MTEEEIMNSSAWRLLNMMIDQKTMELQGWIVAFKDRVDRAYDPSRQQYPPRIDTRIYCEDPDTQGAVTLAASIHELKDAGDIIGWIV